MPERQEELWAAEPGAGEQRVEPWLPEREASEWRELPGVCCPVGGRYWMADGELMAPKAASGWLEPPAWTTAA
ncbi:MAG: hypothetical protein IAE94_02885 [Chthoniobacterales bacterium]|nr:hypothetical protein [Chthoniobacterales bacterium]